MKPEKPPKTSTSRVEAHEEKLLARGGRRLNGIRLKPEAADALSSLEDKGESATSVINRLLIEEASCGRRKVIEGE